MNGRKNDSWLLGVFIGFVTCGVVILWLVLLEEWVKGFIAGD